MLLLRDEGRRVFCNQSAQGKAGAWRRRALVSLTSFLVSVVDRGRSLQQLQTFSLVPAILSVELQPAYRSR